MAGSINLSLSQQFDKLNGNLLSGGRLYFYAAGTDDPQSAYKDSGLTLVHPNPIVLASDGRVPQLYFADGAVHVRLTNSAGVVQFDEDSVLVIGPSSGEGGGSSVDATAIFQTGDPIWLPIAGTRSGWVRLNGRTIGSSTSGAAERANADCQALFEFLWSTYSNTLCPVSTGRGSTALADWTANKTIGLLDFREVVPGGLSDMGNTDRAGFTNVPVESGSRTTAASVVGELLHTLTTNETPAHSHSGTSDANNRGHTHTVTLATTDGKVGGLAGGSAGGNIWFGSGPAATSSDESQDHTHTFTTGNTGSGVSHNTTQRTILGTFYQKL